MILPPRKENLDDVVVKLPGSHAIGDQSSAIEKVVPRTRQSPELWAEEGGA